jgi:hypothetical protein
MNKKVHFTNKLIPLILNGQKTATWRLWDDKDLSVGDVVDFLEFKSEKHFATVELINVLEKPLGELTSEDKLGHEEFENDQQMYETFSNYYKKKVGPKTLVKIIRFSLKSSGVAR